ncbi:MAG: hypothetical protein ACRDIA_00785 [Actinomycetota bacterium]
MSEPLIQISSPQARKTLDERLEEMKTKSRDCRKCRAFRADSSGLGFGWCTAFEQYVKLYHPAGGFWSQCQFKIISRSTAPEVPPQPDPAAAPSPAGRPVKGWVGAPVFETPGTLCGPLTSLADHLS